MIALWRGYQGGMGMGHLPDAGGMGDQAAIMIDAFAAMSAVQADIDEEKRQRERDRRSRGRR